MVGPSSLVGSSLEEFRVLFGPTSSSMYWTFHTTSSEGVSFGSFCYYSFSMSVQWMDVLICAIEMDVYDVFYDSHHVTMLNSLSCSCHLLVEFVSQIFTSSNVACMDDDETLPRYQIITTYCVWWFMVGWYYKIILYCQNITINLTFYFKFILKRIAY